MEQDVQKIATAQPLRAPDGPTRWLRLRITALASTPAVPAFTRAGVAELSIGGVRSTRTYTMPAPAGADGPATYVMSRPPGAASECVKGSRRWVCSPSLGSGDEEGTGFDRTFTSPTAAKAPVTGMAVLTDQRLIARYAAVHGQPVVSASSTLSEHPADQPRSGFDGDQATAWIAGEKENAPAYSVRWKGRKRLSSVTVTRPPGASGPIRVRVEGGDGEIREGLSDAQGRLSFAPITTDRLKLTFFKDNRTQPIQIAEIAVPGVKPFPDVRTYPLQLPCGYGPKLRIGAAAVPTKATGTLGDLLAGRPLRFSACRQAALKSGPNRLASVPLDSFRVESVTVGAKPGAAAARPPRRVKVISWGPGSRELEVDAATTSFLTVNENFNSGWRATAGGTELRAVRLDGWKQGWIVPEGTSGAVELTYTPDRAQRIAVVAGLNLLLVLLLAAVWRGRRDGRRRPDPRALVAGTGWPAWAAVGLAAALGGWIARRSRGRRHRRRRARLRLGADPPLRRPARPRLPVAGRARHAGRDGLPRRGPPAGPDRQPGRPVRRGRRHRPAAARPGDRRSDRGRAVAAEAAGPRRRGRADRAQLDGARAGAGRDRSRRRVSRWTGHSTR
ncbi:hypothetical protein [Actinomadura madurae]|uniref:hypothetical protein n=1 Tax=Actinomadura madurae TaxID=1993 RepID=UPI003FD77440